MGAGTQVLLAADAISPGFSFFLSWKDFFLIFIYVYGCVSVRVCGYLQRAEGVVRPLGVGVAGIRELSCYGYCGPAPDHLIEQEALLNEPSSIPYF